MESLWPKLQTISEDVPVQILKAQAEIFNDSMDGQLECEVHSSDIARKGTFVSGIDTDFTTKLVVTSPSLSNYSLVLVQVNNVVSRAYPCDVINCVKDENAFFAMKANNAEEFKQILASILQSDEVITTLQNLIAQTKNL